MNGRRRWLMAGVSLAFACTAAGLRAQELAQLTSLNDLRVDLAEVRTHRAPLLVLFSTPGCPFCSEVRRNYLAPRVAEQADRGQPDLLIREVDITAATSLVDEMGQSTSQAKFAARFGVRVVPVVMLFDDQLQLLADPLIGIDKAGFYEAYLANAIERGQRRMRR